MHKKNHAKSLLPTYYVKFAESCMYILTLTAIPIKIFKFEESTQALYC